MADAQDPAGGDGGKRRWLPHLSRAGIWLAATVAAAAIGVLVPAVLAGWLPGGGDDDERAATPTATAAETAVPFPPSRQVSQEKIGLFNVEADGTPEGALLAFGEPASRDAEGLTCTMAWDVGVEVRFYDLGGGDPCTDGDFCSATISGREWATTKGLQVGESARRVAELYPQADKIEEGATIRWILEEGVSPCGIDAKGGLEGHSGGGRIYAFEVSYAKGGD